MIKKQARLCNVFVKSMRRTSDLHEDIYVHFLFLYFTIPSKTPTFSPPLLPWLCYPISSFYFIILVKLKLLLEFLFHFKTAYEYHLDSFLAFDNNAFKHLPNELVIIFHRMVFQTVQNGKNLI